MNIEEKLEESIENKYMKDDKMELTIEESVYILKRRDFNAYVEDRAIETLLTAYKKEKEKNKELEKYKTYYDNAKVVWSRNDYISKDKIKEKIGKLEDIRMENLGTQYYGIVEQCENKIEVLQELLKGE